MVGTTHVNSNLTSKIRQILIHNLTATERDNRVADIDLSEIDGYEKFTTENLLATVYQYSYGFTADQQMVCKAPVINSYDQTTGILNVSVYQYSNGNYMKYNSIAIYTCA